MRTARMLGMLAMAAALFTGLPRAWATECASDADCPTGETCRLMTCPGCDPDGGECPPCLGECAPTETQVGDECLTDEDCGEGSVCESIALPCASTCACECKDCPEGEECPPCECPDCMPEPCENEVYRICTAAPWQPPTCETDADCPTMFACQELALGCKDEPTTCACACPEGAAECPPCDCEEFVPEPCESETLRTCVYAPAECGVDADCPADFTCVPEEQCMGGGCACPPCPEGAECPDCDCAEEFFEDTCEVTGHHCEPQEIACSADAECPSGWTCRLSSIPCLCPDCACAAPTPCDAGEECSQEMPACECEPCDCGEADAMVGTCAPEGWDRAYEEQYPGVPGGEYDVDGQPTDGSVDDGAEPPTSETPDDETDTDKGAGASNDGTTEPSAGCTTTGTAPAPYGLGLLFLLALALVRRARG